MKSMPSFDNDTRLLRGFACSWLPLAAATAAWVLAATFDASAAPSAKAMYDAALERERLLRAVFADLQADETVLPDVRTLAAAYEAIVRRYPASAVSDNALWQAGRLELDAFERFGKASDQAAGVRLLRSLATQYPTSALAKRVPEVVRTGRARPVSRPRAIATIKAITRAVLPDAVRVTIEVDTEVPQFHEERLADPPRVFLDLPSTRAAAPLVDQTLQFDSDRDVVRQVRIGRHPNNTTRVVLDAIGVSSYSVYALYRPYRLVIDCARAAEPVGARRQTSIPSLRARSLPWDSGRRLPARKPQASELLAAARVVAQPPPIVA